MAKSKKTKKRGPKPAGRQYFFNGVMMPALLGAGGALGINAIVNYAPLPDSLKEGRMIYLTKAGIAVGAAMFGRRLPVVGPYMSRMAIGALTTAIADLGKDIALEQGFNLSGVGYMSPAQVVGLPRARLSGVAGQGVAGAVAGVGKVGAFLQRNQNAGAFLRRAA